MAKIFSNKTVNDLVSKTGLAYYFLKLRNFRFFVVKMSNFFQTQFLFLLLPSCGFSLKARGLDMILIFFLCKGIRWPLFSYFTSQLTVLNYLCALDTTLRILIKWYKLHVKKYILNFLFSNKLKNYLPCRDLNPGLPESKPLC